MASIATIMYFTSVVSPMNTGDRIALGHISQRDWNLPGYRSQHMSVEVVEMKPTNSAP
jgi:hypothetical protein